MHLLDLTLPNLPANLALDEALLLSAEAGGPEVLRFWEWPGPAVIIGAGGKWHDEAQVAACQRDGVPILRRSSGGGVSVPVPLLPTVSFTSMKRLISGNSAALRSNR